MPSDEDVAAAIWWFQGLPIDMRTEVLEAYQQWGDIK